MSMGGGGSGGSGNQTNTFTPPLWTLNQWPDYVQAASNVASNPQQHFYGQRIAGINNSQAQGMQYLSDLSGNMSPDMQAARRNLQITMSGGFEDPYASAQTLVADNPFMGEQTPGAYNEYIGNSPQFDAVRQAALGDVVQNYQNAIAPGIDASFNHAGAFHAGGHDASIGVAQNNLARNLGRVSNEMNMQQWNRSGDLQQGLLGMNQNAYANDLARNSGLAQHAIDLGVNAQQGDLNRASAGWEQERQRQMGAFGSVLQGNQFDQNNARNMIGIGDIQRGYGQDLLNQQYGDWQQFSNYPGQMLDMYANALSRASGNYGQNMSQSSQMYRANPFAAAVGLGALGAGAYSAWGS